MFTGIIRHIGKFRGYSLSKKLMSLEAPAIAAQLETGESLAVNGVCLSLVKKEKSTLYFNLSEETLKRTNLGSLRVEECLNLELPLTLSSPLSGHLVTGHVDATGKVLNVRDHSGGRRLTVSYPQTLKPYFIPKGSVALNGISLTIADLKHASFDVELVPITLENTCLNLLKRGIIVNLECDIIGKYVYNWIFQKNQNKL